MADGIVSLDDEPAGVLARGVYAEAKKASRGKEEMQTQQDPCVGLDPQAHDLDGKSCCTEGSTEGSPPELVVENPAPASTLVSASCISAAGDTGFVLEESFVAPAGSIGVQGTLPQRELAGRAAAHQAFVAAGRASFVAAGRVAMTRTPEQAAKVWQAEQSAWLEGTDMYVVLALWRFGVRSASDLLAFSLVKGRPWISSSWPFQEKVSSATAQSLHTSFVDVWYSARKAAIPEFPQGNVRDDRTQSKREKSRHLSQEFSPRRGESTDH